MSDSSEKKDSDETVDEKVTKLATELLEKWKKNKDKRERKKKNKRKGKWVRARAHQNDCMKSQSILYKKFRSFLNNFEEDDYYAAGPSNVHQPFRNHNTNSGRSSHQGGHRHEPERGQAQFKRQYQKENKRRDSTKEKGKESYKKEGDETNKNKEKVGDIKDLNKKKNQKESTEEKIDETAEKNNDETAEKNNEETEKKNEDLKKNNQGVQMHID